MPALATAHASRATSQSQKACLLCLGIEVLVILILILIRLPIPLLVLPGLHLFKMVCRKHTEAIGAGVALSGDRVYRGAERVLRVGVGLSVS